MPLSGSWPDIGRTAEKAKLELSCEGKNLDIQLSARLGPPEQQHFPDPPPIIPSVKKKSPSQLRRQERRRQEALSKSNKTTTKESQQDASETTTVFEEAGKSKENSENIKKKSSKKYVAEKVTISEEAGNSKACADEHATNHSEQEFEVLASSLAFKCDQCNFTSNSDKGLKVHKRMKHYFSQLDGHEEEADEPDTVHKHPYEEKETQTDIFLKLNKDGGVLYFFLDILYDNPPPTVYHPVLGKGEYASTDNYKDYNTNNNRKAHCYRFEDGTLIDVC